MVTVIAAPEQGQGSDATSRNSFKFRWFSLEKIKLLRATRRDPLRRGTGPRACGRIGGEAWLLAGRACMSNILDIAQRY